MSSPHPPPGANSTTPAAPRRKAGGRIPTPTASASLTRAPSALASSPAPAPASRASSSLAVPRARHNPTAPHEYDARFWKKPLEPTKSRRVQQSLHTARWLNASWTCPASTLAARFVPSVRLACVACLAAAGLPLNCYSPAVGIVGDQIFVSGGECDPHHVAATPAQTYWHYPRITLLGTLSAPATAEAP